MATTAKRKLTVQILGDAKGLAGAFDDAESKVSKFGSSIAGIAKTAAIGAAAIGAGAVLIAKPLIDAASDLEESMSKMNQVFGTTDARVIEKWSKNSATAFGQSQQAAIDNAASFAGLGKAAGLQGKELLGFSTTLTQLGSDLASFGNTTPEEAIQALGSGLRGEAEPLRRYNILLDDATLRAKAFALGLTKSTKESLTPQQKTLASYAVILEQTKDAQGDFARTSGGLANQQRILAAQFTNVKAQLGQFLLPVATRVLKFFTGTFLPGIQRVVDIFRAEGFRGGIRVIGEQLRAAIPGIKAQLGEWAVAFGGWVKDATPPALRALGRLIADIAQYVVDHAEDWAGKLATWGQRLWDWIEPQIGPALKELGKLIVKIGEWAITDGGPKVKNATMTLAVFAAMWASEVGGKVIAELSVQMGKLAVWLQNDAPLVIQKGAEDFGRWMVKYIIDGIKSAPGAIAGALIDEVPFAKNFLGQGNKLPGIAAGLPEAPQKRTVREILDDLSMTGNAGLDAFGGSFATGGVVPGPMGAPRLVVAHGGERISPVGAASGGGGGAVNTSTTARAGGAGGRGHCRVIEFGI